MDNKLIEIDKTKREIVIPFENIQLRGNLVIPQDAKSIVIFSHGSGNSRNSPRNNYVANLLNNANIATLLVDLLSKEEDQNYDNRFNIDLLTTRLIAVTQFVCKQAEFSNFSVGYLGTSTGAAAALSAAAVMPDYVDAIVLRSGRPDLATKILSIINVPTLLIVGGLDKPIMEKNKKAFSLMKCKKKLIVEPGASHLFEEEGKLDEVTNYALRWFLDIL
jgi:dienelactone hydrolase